MNKLIIIGNGFDLAHGLQTDYKSFLKWYVEKSFTNAFQNREYTDDLLSIQIRSTHHYDKTEVDFLGEFSQFIDDYINGGIQQHGSIKISLNDPWGRLDFVNIELNSALLKSLLGKKGDPSWGDIEHVFYQELKKVLTAHKTNLETKQKLAILNDHLDKLKVLLKEYLLQETRDVNADDQFIQLVEKKVDLTQILETDLLVKNRATIYVRDTGAPDNVLFLDFNYTFLIRKAIRPDLGFRHIPIHGTIDGPLDEMVFGYGDEIDEFFHEMEKSNINEYLRNIKSFGYFKNQHYANLVRYISSEPFVVYLWGHSCSLSDRTLLNMIFEHDNCAAIEIFYYQNEVATNYVELTQNISRHFRDKRKMRNRVSNVKNCQPLPQMSV